MDSNWLRKSIVDPLELFTKRSVSKMTKNMQLKFNRTTQKTRNSTSSLISTNISPIPWKSTNLHNYASLKYSLVLNKIYAIFSDNHYTFMVIELLGKNLYQLFKEEKSIFDQRMAYIYATKMLITIHLLHLANIVYRDIKPENFLLRTG